MIVMNSVYLYQIVIILYLTLGLVVRVDGLRTARVYSDSNFLVKLPTKVVYAAASNSISTSNNDRPLALELSEPVNPGLHWKIKGKTMNFWGVLYAIATLSTAIVILPLMIIGAAISHAIGDGKRRRLLDWMVHFWAFSTMFLSFSSDTKLYGAENLPPLDSKEAVVYIPNHTSFFDILLLSGFIPRPFKYLSKSEILDIPVVGQGMQLAQHVFLKRNDIKSTFQVTDTCIQKLKDGNSMVLFAEGSRSGDGRLKKFKKGAFQMAKAAGAKIIPVSIGNLHRWMPKSAALPLAPIKHTYIQIHPAIETKDKTIKELKSLCFEAVNSGLPQYQKHVVEESPASEE